MGRGEGGEGGVGGSKEEVLHPSKFWLFSVNENKEGSESVRTKRTHSYQFHHSD